MADRNFGGTFNEAWGGYNQGQNALNNNDYATNRVGFGWDDMGQMPNRGTWEQTVMGGFGRQPQPTVNIAPPQAPQVMSPRIQQAMAQRPPTATPRPPQPQPIAPRPPTVRPPAPRPPVAVRPPMSLAPRQRPGTWTAPGYAPFRQMTTPPAGVSMYDNTFGSGPGGGAVFSGMQGSMPVYDFMPPEEAHRQGFNPPASLGYAANAGWNSNTGYGNNDSSTTDSYSSGVGVSGSGQYDSRGNVNSGYYDTSGGGSSWSDGGMMDSGPAGDGYGGSYW